MEYHRVLMLREMKRLSSGSKNKAQAYMEFFGYCMERLIQLDVETVGDLSFEEQKIIGQKYTALVEKYGLIAA